MDRPGGGDSGLPYIKFPIDNGAEPAPFGAYYNSNRRSLDFPIRGGGISELVDLENSTISATIDTERIKKFFNDEPRGKTFIDKQIGLGLTNPRTQVPQALEFAGLSLGNVVLPVTQTYNPLNTLAQVRVSGTGVHFNRQGVAPNIYENPKQTYAYIAGAPENNTETTNRLAILRALKLIGNTNFLVDPATSTSLGIDPGLVDRMGISMIQNQIFNYTGGPGSTYGIGFTRIFRATNTEPLIDPVTKVAYSNIALTYQQLAEQNTTNGLNKAHPALQDFRASINTNILDDAKKLPVFSLTQTLESRLHIGNPGGYLQNSANYTTETLSGQDALNLLNPFYFTANNTTPWLNAQGKADDMIKFAFECIDNDNPTVSAALIFRAFLEGQIQDTNTAEFNTFKYLGRGETFRTYQGFNRSITFTFKIAAQSRQEMRPLYTKLNQLISQVYPDYSPGSNVMRGNVVRLTIGDYLYRMPGFLENVNVTIDNSNTPWEIVLDPNTLDKDMAQLPHFVTVACTFAPIMDILPRKVSQTNSGSVALIANTPTPFLNVGGTTVSATGVQTTTATNSGPVLDKTGLRIQGIAAAAADAEAAQLAEILAGRFNKPI